MRRYIVQRESVRQNARIVRERAGGALVYGVLKAGGYGLGLEELARTLAACGVDRFALTEPEDAALLARMGLPVRELLLLRPVTEREALDRLIRLPAVTFSVGSERDAALLARAGKRLRVTPRAHIQIDCGMGRYGFSAGVPERVRRVYDRFGGAVLFTGIYTHFSCPVKGGATRRQYRRFRYCTDSLERAGYTVGLRHCCSSAAMFHHPEMQLDAVRAGSAFLGRVAHGQRFGLTPVGCCEATVDEVRQLPGGSSIGYGALFHTRRDTAAAVVGVGSVHGFGLSAGHGRQDMSAGIKELIHRALRLFRPAGGLYALVDGRAAPVLGAVCTESCVLDVTGLNCRPGDTVRMPLNPLYRQNMECVWLEGGQSAQLPGTARPARLFRPVA